MNEDNTMTEQHWFNKTPEQLSKLSDQRLSEILKRARKHRITVHNSYRDDVANAVSNAQTSEEAKLNLPTIIRELTESRELSDSESYFQMVKSECSTRDHFKSK